PRSTEKLSRERARAASELVSGGDPRLLCEDFPGARLEVDRDQRVRDGGKEEPDRDPVSGIGQMQRRHRFFPPERAGSQIEGHGRPKWFTLRRSWPRPPRLGQHFPSRGKAEV